jgi:hypothetical protein
VSAVFTRDLSTWLDDDLAGQLLRAYLGPGNFSGAMWDGAVERRSAEHYRNVIDAEDLYLPALLSAPIRRTAGHTILLERDRIEVLLTAVDPHLELWGDASEVEESLLAAEELIRLLQGIKHIGPTRASKLVAGKRPRLIPIWDLQVSAAIGAGGMTWMDYWTVWRGSLTQECVGQLDLIASEAGSPGLSPLRVLDIVIWMSEWGWRDLTGDQWAPLREACQLRLR